MRAVAARRNALRAPAKQARTRPYASAPGPSRLGRPLAASSSTSGFRTGASETIRGTFLVGADGIGSVVRSAIGARVRRDHDPRALPDDYRPIMTSAQAMPDLSNISYLSDPREWYVLIRTASVWRALFPVDASLEDKDVTSPERGERLLQGAVPRSGSVRSEASHGLSGARARRLDLCQRAGGDRGRCGAREQSARRHGPERRDP